MDTGFSEARNYATSLADSDWVIAVDSDEILVREDVNSIRAIAGLYDDKDCVVSLIQLNRTAIGMETLATSRMFKKVKVLESSGRILFTRNLFRPKKN